jgi:hypothetical protein
MVPRLTTISARPYIANTRTAPSGQFSLAVFVPIGVCVIFIANTCLLIIDHGTSPSVSAVKCYAIRYAFRGVVAHVDASFADWIIRGNDSNC